MVILIFIAVLIILEFPVILELIEKRDKVSDLVKDTETEDVTVDETVALKTTTLVIPVRNEEKNIPNLINSLKENVDLDILIVDDYSTDDSYNMMVSMTSDCDNISIVKMETEEGIELAPRQKVLNFAYKLVKTEFVTVTDADIVIGKHWQNFLLKELSNPDVKFLYGYTYIKPKSLIGKIESIELFFLFAVAFGLKKIKLPSSCMGNNMTINLEAFNEAGGYETTGYAFNDDQAVLDLFTKAYSKEAVVGSERLALETSEIGEYHGAVSQKIRWVNDAMRYDVFFIVPILFLVIFSLFLLFSSFTTKLFFAINFSIFIAAYSKFFNENRVFEKLFLLNIYIYIAPMFYLVNYFMKKTSGTAIKWKGNDV